MPKATVVSLDFNATGQGKNGPYSYVEFVTQADPYKGTPKAPRTHRLFPGANSAVIANLKDFGIKAGDRVSYTTDDDRWKTITSVQKEEGAPAPATGTPPQQNKAPQQDYNKDDDEVGKRIARSTALKGGVDIVAAMMNSGKGKGITATVKPEVLSDLVLSYSSTFFDYLWDGPKELTVDMTGVGDADDLPPEE